MTQFTVMATVGLLAGPAAFVLGIAQLACEHARASHTQRLTTLALAICAAWTGLDCWDFVTGIEDTVDSKAIAFSIALALSWGYRRSFGIKSTPRPGAKSL